jgi:hypothetical protein
MDKKVLTVVVLCGAGLAVVLLIGLVLAGLVAGGVWYTSSKAAALESEDPARVEQAADAVERAEAARAERIKQQRVAAAEREEEARVAVEEAARKARVTRAQFASRQQYLDRLHSALGELEAKRRSLADYAARALQSRKEADDKRLAAEKAGQPAWANHYWQWANYWQWEFEAANGWVGRMDTEIGQIKARIDAAQ